jgi:hypothetical protein
MAAFLPEPRRKMKWWFPYFLFVVIVLFLFWKIAPGRFISYLDRLSPFHVGTPQISGTVVNAVTGRPVAGMDVCLLVTYMASSFVHRPTIEVMRTVMTQTDASGRFFFARWDVQRDFSDNWDGYGFAVTDPAAHWKEMCGRDIYLLGKADFFERETQLQSLADSAAKSTAPYFPVAMVTDPDDPHPSAYGTYVSFGHSPDRTLVRRISDPSSLRIALVPLLRDTNECRSAPDSDSAELCREMNESLTADDLRAVWKFSAPGR